MCKKLKAWPIVAEKTPVPNKSKLNLGIWLNMFLGYSFQFNLITSINNMSLPNRTVFFYYYKNI